jgi:hypothetical protein
MGKRSPMTVQKREREQAVREKRERKQAKKQAVAEARNASTTEPPETESLPGDRAAVTQAGAEGPAA